MSIPPVVRSSRFLLRVIFALAAVNMLMTIVGSFR